MKAFYLLLILVFSSLKSLACDSTQIRMDSTWVGPGPWPMNYDIDFNCLDSSLTLHFKDPLRCSSVETNGKNFTLFNSSGQQETIIKASTSSCSGDSSYTLNIKLKYPLSVNGKYFLEVHADHSGQLIKNICGATWNSDTVILNVSGCFNPQFELIAINKITGNSLKLHWTVDTNSFPIYLFDQFNIYRKKPLEQAFLLIDSVVNVNQHSYLDNTLPISFTGVVEYYLALKINRIEMVKSDTLTYNVLLSTKENSLYPIPFTNPVKDEILLNLNEKTTIQIIDINGRLVERYLFYNDEQSINVQHLPKGIYFLIWGDKERIVFKFLKE